MAKSSGGSGRKGGGARLTATRLAAMSESELGDAWNAAVAAGDRRRAGRLSAALLTITDARLNAQAAARRARGERSVGGAFEIGNWIRAVDRAAQRRRG